MSPEHGPSVIDWIIFLLPIHGLTLIGVYIWTVVVAFGFVGTWYVHRSGRSLVAGVLAAVLFLALIPVVTVLFDIASGVSFHVV